MRRTIIKFSMFLASLIYLSPSAQADEPIKWLGDYYQVIPATALASTIIFQDWEGSRQFCKSAITSMALTQSLKLIVNEPRPNGHGHASFPSGHTSASFFGASFVQRRYGWKYGAPAYLAATCLNLQAFCIH